MQPLIDALVALDTRLDGAGLVNTVYGRYLGDISVAYHDVPFRHISQDCVHAVGIHARNARNEYVEANTAWDRCIENFACDTDAIEGLQRHWAKAFREIREAQQGLGRLEP